MLHFTSTQPVAVNMLATRAMLASVHISVWTARKVDKKVSAETNAANYASSDAGRYNKALLAKEALAAVTTAASTARLAHYSKTLPWMDDGARILPAAAYDKYTADLRAIRFQFETAVAEFVSNYSNYVADARRRLGDMYNADEYPEPAQIESKFKFETRILPMPDATDFRVDIGDSIAAQIRADISRDTHIALESAQRDVWNRIAGVVGHMVEKLGEYKPATRKGDKVTGIFRDSLVENIRELVDILPALNLTADPYLADVIARLARELCAHDADTLRESDHIRETTAANAAKILADVSDFLA
jgi:hypothetical protein